MSITVADALALAVKRHGVTEIFGQSLPSAFFLAAAKYGLRQVSYRTENAGGAMADGYARISNKVTLVGAQNGPAATLLVPPFAEAMKASIPLIGLVQDVPTTVRDRNAFQELDHFELFRGCTKWVRQLNDPSRVDDYVDMAFTAAASGRPGPVVLLLPKDILVEEAVGSPVGRRRSNLGTFPLDRGRASADQVARAAKLLAEASQPLVIAGGGVHLSGAYDAIADLQSVAHLPVATTTMGKGSVDEGNPLSAGQVGSFMGRTSPTRALRDVVQAADVILLVGTRTNENATDTWRGLPTDATYIHVDVDPVEVNRNYDAVRLVGDARSVLEDLVAELAGLDLDLRLQREPAVIESLAAIRVCLRRRGARGPHLRCEPDPSGAGHGGAEPAPHAGHDGRRRRELFHDLDGRASSREPRRTTLPLAARTCRSRLGTATRTRSQARTSRVTRGLHRRGWWLRSCLGGDGDRDP